MNLLLFLFHTTHNKITQLGIEKKYFYTMAYIFVIYWYVISKWRSIRPVEINQYDITMATHYAFTMGNDIARDVHDEITMGNGVVRDSYCDITINIDVVMLWYVHYATSLPIVYYIHVGSSGGTSPPFRYGIQNVMKNRPKWI